METRSAADFRMLRETLDLSQAWVARMVGVTTLTVVHWEDPNEFALPRNEAWNLIEGLWAEANRRAAELVDMASKSLLVARENGHELSPISLSYWKSLKEQESSHPVKASVVAGKRIDASIMMRIDNAACRMAVDRLHLLGIPLSIVYAEVGS